MQWKRITMLVGAVAAIAVCNLRAEDRQGAADREGQKWLTMVANRLGLNEQQKQAILKSHKECERKAGPIEQQIWSTCYAEREAIKQQLTQQQRERFNEAVKSMQVKELDVMATKLGLNAQQKQRLAAICSDFERKFDDLAANQENGDKTQQQFHDLRHEFVAAVRPELTAEQQTKLPFVIEEEHRRWRDPSVRREHLMALLDKLDVNPQQREQIKAINARYEKQLEPLFAELKQIHKEGREAVDNQLTAEQREKLREMRTAYGDQQ